MKETGGSTYTERSPVGTEVLLEAEDMEEDPRRDITSPIVGRELIGTSGGNVLSG